MSSITALAQKFKSIWPLLDERTRRIMAANEALGLGYGGVSMVHRACGLSRKVIGKGIREIEEGNFPSAGRIRRPGDGALIALSSGGTENWTLPVSVIYGSPTVSASGSGRPQ